ncbi:MAG: transcription elongation factor GreB [Polyangia bacterium]
MAPTNYITPRGWRAIIDELEQLVLVERPKVVREVSTAAAEGDRSENAAYIYGKRRLREIDGRTGFLQRRLKIIEVVDGRKQSRAKVYFGALVDTTVESGAGEGERVRYHVVGVDEVDAKKGRISWESPVGRALLGRKIGDTVKVTWHAGERELAIDAIDYLDDPPPGEQAEAVAKKLAETATLAEDAGEAEQQKKAPGRPARRSTSRTRR